MWSHLLLHFQGRFAICYKPCAIYMMLLGRKTRILMWCLKFFFLNGQSVLPTLKAFIYITEISLHYFRFNFFFQFAGFRKRKKERRRVILKLLSLFNSLYDLTLNFLMKLDQNIPRSAWTIVQYLRAVCLSSIMPNTKNDIYYSRRAITRNNNNNILTF